MPGYLNSIITSVIEILKEGQFAKQHLTICDKKARQLLMYIETVCVCRFIQTV